MSPATRSTKMLIRYLGLSVEFRLVRTKKNLQDEKNKLYLSILFSPIDVTNGEQLKAEFLKINPTHTLPTLDDDGFILWDSHAINTYLIMQYSEKSHYLYPTDVVQRARIDQFLHFDGSTLFPRFFDIVREVFWQDKVEPSEFALQHASEALSFLNTFLDKSPYLAGENLTIADISCVTVPLTFQRLIPSEYNKYPNVKKWIERIRNDLPYFDEINVEKLNVLEKLFTEQKRSNKEKADVTADN